MKKMIKKVSRSCPLCSSKDQTQVFAEENIDQNLLDDFAFASRKMPEHMHHRLVLCPVCDLVYATPLPTLKDIAEGYQEAAFDSSQEAHFAARTYSRQLPGIMRKIQDTQGALDVGTGDGAFLEELLEKGFTKVQGVEPSKAPILASLPHIKPLIRFGLFKAGDFKPNSQSLVTCFQTFEHLYDPMKMCGDFFKITRKGGAFFAVCHNRRSFSAKVMGRKSPIFDIEHLQLFSPRSAEFMLRKAGFMDIEVKPIFNSYPLHYWIKLLPLPRGLKTSMIKILKKTPVGQLPIPLPAGNMAVIGYKK